jgi:hypothetical protein
MTYPIGRRNSNGGTPRFGRDCAAGLLRSADIDTSRVAADTTLSLFNAGSPPMNRLFSSILFLSAAVVTLPAVAQTPPTQGWPANRPPDQSAPQAKPPQATPPAAPKAATPPAQGAPAPQAGAQPAPVPLPPWFVEIDKAKKGEVSRADFVKYRMKSFEELDTTKDG